MYTNDCKPLITIPTKHLGKFSKIITSYNCQETKRPNQYLIEEVIFNQPKIRIKNNLYISILKKIFKINTIMIKYKIRKE